MCFPDLFTPKSVELSLFLASLLGIFSVLLAIPELTIDLPPWSKGRLQRQPLWCPGDWLQLSNLLETAGADGKDSCGYSLATLLNLSIAQGSVRGEQADAV